MFYICKYNIFISQFQIFCNIFYFLCDRTIFRYTLLFFYNEESNFRSNSPFGIFIVRNTTLYVTNNQLIDLISSKNKKTQYNKSVNIFHKRNYCITSSLSTLCKTYCFAFQKRRFCTVKAALLHCKTAAFASPNRNYHFPVKLFLQKQGYFHILFYRI